MYHTERGGRTNPPSERKGVLSLQIPVPRRNRFYLGASEENAADDSFLLLYGTLVVVPLSKNHVCLLEISRGPDSNFMQHIFANYCFSRGSFFDDGWI